MVDKEQLKYYDNSTSYYTSGAEVLLDIINNNTVVGIGVWFRKDKLLQIDSSWCAHNEGQTVRIKAIYGIK